MYNKIFIITFKALSFLRLIYSLFIIRRKYQLDYLNNKFKKSRLDIDKELHRKAKYDASKLITTKKQAFFEEELSETIGKSKELWESLLSLQVCQTVQ